jgi:hypothetical protein
MACQAIGFGLTIVFALLPLLLGETASGSAGKRAPRRSMVRQEIIKPKRASSGAYGAEPTQSINNRVIVAFESGKV